jgi:S-methylmethionine-dependent homocysteine/selenocysteine methylase/SAM-dependent methyltransferase
MSLSAGSRTGAGSAYQTVLDAIAAQRCVVLDGGTATELPRPRGQGGLDERLWGTRALIDEPDQVLDVHRRYVAAGCDVISTNTWGLPSALLDDGPRLWESTRPIHWMDIARQGVRLAREAAAPAVAFSLNGDLDRPGGEETVRLLARAFASEPPDLVLLETLSLVRPSLFSVVEGLLETGLPVWLSFRRCRHGLCGVYGQHWGGPEGDAFGRAARRFEELGVAALLVNCIPPDHVDGMVSYLRDFTDLPLGVYPNLGYYTSAGWRFEEGVGGSEYAEMALRWRGEGAQIVGGCCGVGPEHIAAARDRLADTKPGRERSGQEIVANGRPSRPTVAPRWSDDAGRPLYPLEFPDLVAGDEVFAPTQGSFVVWKHLFRERIGRDRRCLDIGCGTGLQTIQLALNGADHVHGIDLDPEAVALTMTNAFRNGVSERVTAATADLFAWLPDERYEVIVASLFQTPVDPFQNVASHRPLDYWGRSAVDHVIGMLPEALTPDGEAYLLHLSILSQGRTEQMLAEHDLEAEVVDYTFFPFADHFHESEEQIARVESLSDAYHLEVGGEGVMIAYLLRVTRRRS